MVRFFEPQDFINYYETICGIDNPQSGRSMNGGTRGGESVVLTWGI